MIDELRRVLIKGVERALAEQSESTNRSFVMQGKGDAFREVLQVLDALQERSEVGGSETVKVAEEAQSEVKK